MTSARPAPSAGDAEPHGQVLSVPARRRPAIVSEFQPDAVEVEERAPSRLARATLYLVTALIAAATAWACLTEIDEIAVTRGKLITTEPNIVVQPLENALIRTIEVSVGQTVTAGQVLAVLDPTFTDADGQQLAAKFEAADAMVKRLEAELEGRDDLPFDVMKPEQALEARLARQRKAFNDSRLRSFDEEMARAESSLARSRREDAILVQRLAGIREIEEMRGTLLANQTGSRLNLLQSRDTRLDIEASLARVRGAQVEAGHEFQKARSQRQAFLDEFGRTALESLVEARGRRDAASEEMKKADLRRRLVALTSPADAVVLEIGQRSSGSVIRQAEPLFTLVPTNVAIEAEVLVDPKDIGHVARRQTARIKFDAFPFQKHGTLNGVVRTLSQDAFPSDAKDAAARNGTLFYKARLTLSAEPLRAIPVGGLLMPGMAVQAEIAVGRRRVISYFLYPLLKNLDESIGEP